jgi:hypothetical protein
MRSRSSIVMPSPGNSAKRYRTASGPVRKRCAFANWSEQTNVHGQVHRLQRWSRALHDHPDSPDGILYRPRHDPARIAAALFDRIRREVIAENLGTWLDQKVVLAEVLDPTSWRLFRDRHQFPPPRCQRDPTAIPIMKESGDKLAYPILAASSSRPPRRSSRACIISPMVDQVQSNEIAFYYPGPIWLSRRLDQDHDPGEFYRRRSGLQDRGVVRRRDRDGFIAPHSVENHALEIQTRTAPCRRSLVQSICVDMLHAGPQASKCAHLSDKLRVSQAVMESVAIHAKGMIRARSPLESV